MFPLGVSARCWFGICIDIANDIKTLKNQLQGHFLRQQLMCGSKRSGMGKIGGKSPTGKLEPPSVTHFP